MEEGKETFQCVTACVILISARKERAREKGERDELRQRRMEGNTREKG